MPIAPGVMCVQALGFVREGDAPHQQLKAVIGRTGADMRLGRIPTTICQCTQSSLACTVAVITREPTCCS